MTQSWFYIKQWQKKKNGDIMENKLYYYKNSEQSKKIQIYMKVPGFFSSDNEGLVDEKIGTIKYNEDKKQYEFHKSFFLEGISHEVIQGLDKIMTELEKPI